MLMMTMMSMQIGILMPVIMMDSYNIEYDSVNGDADEDKSEYGAVNGDNDADSFGADNARTNNASTNNDDDDIDATDDDDSYAGSNGNSDPNDIYAQNNPALLSSVVQSCLAIYTCLRLWI